MGKNRTGDYRVGRGITDHVFVDVDGTLLIWPTKGGGATGNELSAFRTACTGGQCDARLLPKVNVALVSELQEWQRRRNGRIVIWTMGGPDHANMARVFCGLEGDVLCIGKPDLIVDDAGQALIAKKHRVVMPQDFRCPDA